MKKAQSLKTSTTTVILGATSKLRAAVGNGLTSDNLQAFLDASEDNHTDPIGFRLTSLSS